MSHIFFALLAISILEIGLVKAMSAEIEKRPIYTIGHSTHEIAFFIALLDSFGIEEVVDIRTIPRSRHNPQFNLDTLPSLLKKNKIAYRHEKDLGGLRKPQKNSINKAWHNPSFRAYADYMQSGEFLSAIEDLIRLAMKKTTVLMCAEALPWRCHRSLIADALIIRHIEVYDIFDLNKCKIHTLSPWAKVRGIKISYP